MTSSRLLVQRSYSVSCDTEFVHKAWHEESERISKVTYPMLADPAHVLARNFEVLIEDAGLAERGAFIVDPEGVIQVELCHRWWHWP